MKPKFSLPLLLLCSSVLAAEEGASFEDLNRKIDELTLESVWGTKGAKTAPAIANPAGKGLFITESIDYLYWRAYENGVFQVVTERSDNTFLINPQVAGVPVDLLSLIFLRENWDTNNTIRVDVDLSEVKFDFDSGYRIGLGWASSSLEHWDLQVAFTQFTNRAHKEDSFCCPSAATCTPELDPDAAYTPIVFGSINAEQNPLSVDTSWKINYYNLDLSLGRFFFLSKYLALRPHLGGRGSIINQKKDTQLLRAGDLLSTYIGTGYVTQTDSTIEKRQTDDLCVDGAKNYFWGVGPLFGIEGRWFLTKNLNIYTVASASLMFGKFSLSETVHFTQANNTIFNFAYLNSLYEIPSTDFANCITQSFSYDPFAIVPSGRLSVGLEFDYPFKNDAFVVSLRAGYEVEYYWRQNYLGSPTVLLTPNVTDFDATSFAPAGTIATSGVSAGQIFPVDGFVSDALFLSQSAGPIVMPNSPGDLAFHGLVVGASLGF